MNNKFNIIEFLEIQRYLQQFFPKTLYEGMEKEKLNDSYITFYKIGSLKKYHMQVKCLYDNQEFYKVIDKFDKYNLGVTYNSFFKPYNEKKYMYSVNSLVLDIDYSKNGYTYDSVIYFLENDCFRKFIPEPTYIEKGHNLRLIYILSSPVYIAKRKDYLQFIQFLQNSFCKSEELKELGADVQILNSYIRIPYSINTKDFSIVESIPYRNSQKYTLQDIVDEYMNDRSKLPAWYKTKKQIKKMQISRKDKYIKMRLQHNQKVLKDLETIQIYFNSTELSGHREMLCFLYRNYAFLAYDNSEKALEAMLEFNKKFKLPLEERKIIIKTNNINRKRYTYKNKTILNILGLSGNEVKLSILNSSVPDRKEYFKAYYIKHKNKKLSKKQKMIQYTKQLILKLKKIGKKNKDIVVSLASHNISLSLKSVERFIHNLIIEGLYSPH